jgi:predicted phage terminase large subunit-like protein
MAQFNFDIDPVALLKSRKQRLDISNSFEEWCKYLLAMRTNQVTGKPQTIAAHHKIFIDVISAVLRGDTKRVIVSTPQGTAKTSFFSHFFPPFWLSKNKQGLILSFGHTDQFAITRLGAVVRDLIKEHRLVLDIDIAQDSSARHDWYITDLENKKLGGNYRSMGVLGGLFGYRAWGIICEDPQPDWVTAQSKIEQDKIAEWWFNSVVPRALPTAFYIIVATRTSAFDLIAHVKERDERLGIHWDEIRLPMVSEGAGDPLGRPAGERIWKEYFTDEMERQARGSGPYVWATAWQQNPVVAGGGYFRAEWLLPVHKTPRLADMYLYAASDFATSTKTSADFTVHVVCGFDRATKRLYLLDVWRQKTVTSEWISAMIDLYEKYKGPEGSGIFIRKWAIEKGVISNSVGPFMAEQMKMRKAPINIKAFASVHDKETRAQSLRGHMSLGWDPIHEVMAPNTDGGLRYPSGALWWPDVQNELLSFPLSLHDDLVDALALVGLMIDRDGPVAPPPERVAPKIFSTDHRTCNVTLTELFDANEHKGRYANPRIR